MSSHARWCLPCVASAGALLLACAPAAAAPHVYTVVIDKMKFGAVPPGLHKGDAIVWDNHDFLMHSATALDHSFDANIPKGAKVKTTLTRSGSIAFFCRYHPGMHGVIQVK